MVFLTFESVDEIYKFIESFLGHVPVVLFIMVFITVFIMFIIHGGSSLAG